LFRPPDEFRGVRLESELSVQKLFDATNDLDSEAVYRVTTTLAGAVPAQ
jgi:hypothetical protein